MLGPVTMEPDPDQLDVEELVPTGGSWGGLLFDNPHTGLPPRLTWTFEFEFREVEREYGDTPVTASVDWVPLPDVDWKRMSPRRVACSTFAEPIESSVYFFLHHRFDAVELELVQQRRSLLRVAAVLSGDLDGLGSEEVRLDAWLEFTGIATALTRPLSQDETSVLLSGFTDPSGLLPAGRGGGGFLFSPAPESRP